MQSRGRDAAQCVDVLSRLPVDWEHPFDDVLARKRPQDFANKREARRVIADVSYIALKAAA